VNGEHAAAPGDGTIESTVPRLLGVMGLVRASGRLALLALLVTATNLLTRAFLRLGLTPSRSAPHVFSRLARILIRLLGVEVRFDGEAPGELCVVVANHRSYVDIPLVMSLVPSVFLAKSEIASWPAFGTAARLARTVFVDRDDSGSRKLALAALGAALDGGETITVFPEGTTTTGPGCLPFRLGAFRLAAARGLPVVPIAIAYAERGDAWVDDTSFVAHFLERFRARRMIVSLTIGPEIHDSDAWRLKDHAEGWIRERLAVADTPA
jgi:lyso-ornithine lipid O-acyltransferase